MFIVVLIVFGVCWLPYHAYFFYTYYHSVRDQLDPLEQGNVFFLFFFINSYEEEHRAGGLLPIHCALCTVHCKLYTGHCTLYTVNCTLYTGHCTL